MTKREGVSKPLRFEILKRKKVYFLKIHPTYRGGHNSQGIHLLSVTRVPVKPLNIHDINEEIG